jgi:UPF0716 protein FxsA
MFRLLLVLFILVPIVEIAVFIQVGDQIGLTSTLFVVIITAILGVNLLKQQGFRAWRDIQLSLAQGQVPALEMASAAQLLFAGALLLTPGFVTDTVGFLLMIPQVRLLLAKRFFKLTTKSPNSHQSTQTTDQSATSYRQVDSDNGRIIEGEFEEKDQ